MRYFCAAIGAAFFAFSSQAEELKERADWRYCSQDVQCVAIQGVCGVTAVNYQVKDVAARYYREKAKTTKCIERFWEQKMRVARCYRGGCETIPKQAASTNAVRTSDGE